MFLAGETPKITGIGITEFTQPGQEIDLTRWMAMETFRSRSYHSKCDVWSFGVLLWEVTTLGEWGKVYDQIGKRDFRMIFQGGHRIPR